MSKNQVDSPALSQAIKAISEKISSLKAEVKFLDEEKTNQVQWESSTRIVGYKPRLGYKHEQNWFQVCGTKLDRFMLTLQSESLPYMFYWSLGVYLRY